LWKWCGMARDLGSPTGQVHDQAAAVLRFWFDETPDKAWYAKDDALDAEIIRRFRAMRDEVVRTDAAGWRDDPDALLAAIILLDQFSRNMFRGDAEAFAADPLARELVDVAIAQGWDRRLDPRRRQFLYMPFMHAEDRAVQQRSRALFAGTDNEVFAKRHAEQIERFGRFPQRNAALGRVSTPEEEAFLSQPGARF
jgi:uncharacterized protein (DUF924 family)